MARVYGYTRPTASLPDHRTHAAQLAAAGADRIFVEKDSGQARRGMRERQQLLKQIAPGDTLILPSLDRLGTSLEDVLRCFERLVDRGVEVKIVEPGFESAGALGSGPLLKLLVGTVSALHSETIKGSLAAARAAGGKAAGKSPSLTPDQWPDIQARIAKAPLDAVAEELGVSRQTLWTYRRRMTNPDSAAAT